MTLAPTSASDELVRQSNHPHARSPAHISTDSPNVPNPAMSLADGGESKHPSVTSSRRRLPLWVKEQLPGWGERFCLPEWDVDDDVFEGDQLLSDESEWNDMYRRENGWKGKDLCHSCTSPVRISHYAVRHGNDGIGTTITGVAHFTPRAESHAGFCHGGSMTSVMDDIIGWTAFHATGRCIPWSGFTAQINVTLKRPISVGSYLKIMGTIMKREGRKIWVHAQLSVGGCCESEGEDAEVVHCTAEGLAILKREC